MQRACGGKQLDEMASCETRAVAEQPFSEDGIEEQVLESTSRIGQVTADMENDEPSGPQEVKAECDDKEQVDDRRR